MPTGRALQQVLQSWQSAGLGHLPKLAVSATEPSPAPAVAATVPVAPSPPQDTVPDMARKQAAAARPELPVIAVAPEIKMPGSREDRLDFGHSPMLKPVGGKLALPDGPGWGIEYDPAIWKNATRL